MKSSYGKTPSPLVGIYVLMAATDLLGTAQTKAQIKAPEAKQA